MLSHMTDTDLNVHIGNHELLQCNNIKYLGVDIDNVLSWDIQTDSISKKLVFYHFSTVHAEARASFTYAYVYLYEHYPTEN